MMDWSDIWTFFSKTTPGTPALYVLVVMGLAFWWKGLPALIDAISNRQSKIEERMGALLAGATERFEHQITAADKRHEDCMEGQERLRKRVEEQDTKIERQAKRISELEESDMAKAKIIEGLKRQMVQMQVSTLRVAPSQAGDGVLDHMMNQLDQLTSPKGV